ALGTKELASTRLPRFFRSFQLDRDAISTLLDRAPMEFAESETGTPPMITIPLPNGSFARFRIERSPVLEPALAAQVPAFQSFRGQGVDDPTQTARFDLGPNGFHATVLAGRETVNVAPISDPGNNRYIAFYRHDSTAEQLGVEYLEPG